MDGRDGFDRYSVVTKLANAATLIHIVAAVTWSAARGSITGGARDRARSLARVSALLLPLPVTAIAGMAASVFLRDITLN